MRRTVLPSVALVAVTALLSACAGDDRPTDGRGSGGVTGTTLPTLASRVPKDMLDEGEIVVGSDIAYPPVEFYTEGSTEVQGLDHDLCQEIAAKLGLENGCRFDNGTFDALLAGLRAGRFDIVMSAMSDTEARRRDGVDFIDYFAVGTSILVARGNPAGIASLDDLCGRTVGVQRGTTQEDLAREQATACDRAGRKLDILTFDSDTAAVEALKGGRSAADLSDFPVAAYHAATSGGGDDFEVVGAQIRAAPYGIAVPADETDLRDLLRDALRAIIADGTYDRVLSRWNVLYGSLKTATINGNS